MPAEKFSVSLPKSLATELDELARADGSSRSFVIQEATARYVADRRAQTHAQRRRSNVDVALTGFDEIAAAWGEDSRQGVEYLDELRQRAALPAETKNAADE